MSKYASTLGQSLGIWYKNVSSRVILLFFVVKYNFYRHEGRTWYTEHRGRLWIHAAGKEPQSGDILEIEKTYCDIYDGILLNYNNEKFKCRNFTFLDPGLVFPRKYPTSCLLGCVFVEDCVSQERYRQLYPDGESDSPYVLICTNPMILPVFYPMQGQHKICKLLQICG